MRVLTARDVAEALSFPDLIEALRRGFRTGAVAPMRHHHTVAMPDQPDATLLLMPAWNDFAAQGHSSRGYLGVKTITVYPGNAARARTAVAGVYLLFSGETGAPLAVIDGQALTLWRTSAASALASSYLSREDASRVLMVGAGALAPYLVEAHASVRPVREVLVWNRSHERAAALAQRMAGRAYSVSATDDLEGAARGADVISCATLSSEPLIRGGWLAPGVHLDLVGGFTPTMREADDEAVRRARLFCDTREGALAEGGDLAAPLALGVVSPDDVAGDLFDLTRGVRAGRRFYDQITLFKSVGHALEDLTAAALVFARA